MTSQSDAEPAARTTALIPAITRVIDHPACVRAVLGSYPLELVQVGDDAPIPGSYWGEPEAGLVGQRLFWRADTPLHSLLHEASHYICMDSERRAALSRDAGGDHPEENAVCYLQILLAEAIEGFGLELICRDMDAWGYTFRLGSARAWFEQDAQDAREWLARHALIDGQGRPSGKCREDYVKSIGT